jgi:hypothetical protein
MSAKGDGVATVPEFRSTDPVMLEEDGSMQYLESYVQTKLSIEEIQQLTGAVVLGRIGVERLETKTNHQP